jgi:hypothetical protein
MLRNAILGICLLLLFGFVGAAMTGGTDWMPAAMLALFTAAVAFERIRYKDKVGATPRAPLSPTSERFIDPESGAQVQVWANAGGERHYVESPKD